MSTIQDLMGLGMSGWLAGRLGNSVTLNLAGVGTAQTGAAAITNKVTTATTSSGQTAFVLPTNASIGSVWYFFNQSATAALVYPPPGVSGTINGGSTDASFSVAQNKPTIFVRASTAVWMANLSA
jgi:hypothetical protein